MNVNNNVGHNKPKALAKRFTTIDEVLASRNDTDIANLCSIAVSYWAVYLQAFVSRPPKLLLLAT
jgi:hypothetical protein